MACRVTAPANERIKIDRTKERFIQELDWKLGGDRRAYGKRREPFAKVDQEVTFQGDCQIKINYLVNKCYFCVKSADSFS